VTAEDIVESRRKLEYGITGKSGVWSRREEKERKKKGGRT
jgi:hypothetical protein